MPKVMVVDDDPKNRDMLSKRLVLRGFEVMSAAGAEEALSLVESDPPDVILMDLLMPEVDGYEATRRLKGSPRTSSIPVIALSARAMVGDREKALEAGCDEYEPKPFDMNRLMAKVASFLSKRSEN